MKKFVFFGLMGLLFCIQDSFAQDRGINVSVDIYISENTNDCHVCRNNGSYAFTCSTNGCGHDGFVCSSSHSIVMCDVHYRQCREAYGQEQVAVSAQVHVCGFFCNHDRYYNGARYRVVYNVYGYRGNTNSYCRDDFYRYNNGYTYGRNVQSPYYGPSHNRQRAVSSPGRYYNQPWRNVQTRNVRYGPRPR